MPRSRSNFHRLGPHRLRCTRRTVGSIHLLVGAPRRRWLRGSRPASVGRSPADRRLQNRRGARCTHRIADSRFPLVSAHCRRCLRDTHGASPGRGPADPRRRSRPVARCTLRTLRSIGLPQPPCSTESQGLRSQLRSQMLAVRSQQRASSWSSPPSSLHVRASWTRCRSSRSISDHRAQWIAYVSSACAMNRLAIHEARISPVKLTTTRNHEGNMWARRGVDPRLELLSLFPSQSRRGWLSAPRDTLDR